MYSICQDIKGPEDNTLFNDLFLHFGFNKTVISKLRVTDHNLYTCIMQSLAKRISFPLNVTNKGYSGSPYFTFLVFCISYFTAL